jgi:hypothetical protein
MFATDQTERTRVYNACMELDAEGIFPAPKAVLERLGLTSTVPRDSEGKLPAGARLNATKSSARAEALRDLGYEKDIVTGRWTR